MKYDTAPGRDRQSSSGAAGSNAGSITPFTADLDAHHPASIEDQIEAAVDRAVSRLLGPHLRKLSGPEPVVFTVGQVAVLLQISEDPVGRLVKRGVLPRVPHLDGKVLIPRDAVERLAQGQGQVEEAAASLPANARSIRSAAWRPQAAIK